MVSLKHGAMVFAMAVAALVAAPAGAEDPAPLPPPGEPESVGEFVSFDIVGKDAERIFFRVEATPQLWHRIASFSYSFPDGFHVIGHAPVMPGISIVCMPRPAAGGVYRIEAGSSVKEVPDVELGAN